jgi:hypothetical protein
MRAAHLRLVEENQIPASIADLAEVVQRAVEVRTDWEGLQLTVMRDGSITYDIQEKKE